MIATDTSPPPLGQSLSDEELMGQLAAGRQDALGPLHGRYASLVFNLAARKLDRATAEEIAQDVFVAVWRKAGTFDPTRGTFRTWVLQIAHFRVINELRQRGRRPASNRTRKASASRACPSPALAPPRRPRGSTAAASCARPSRRCRLPSDRR
jgi:RNA polymerase sigma-70 factor (ECF subfamily)